MRLKQLHGRVGEGTEYYEWRVQHPKVFVQRVGERWLLGINHLDRTLQVLCYFTDVDNAKYQGKRLAQQYAQAEHYTVEEDVALAHGFGEALAASAVPGLCVIIDTTGQATVTA